MTFRACAPICLLLLGISGCTPSSPPPAIAQTPNTPKSELPSHLTGQVTYNGVDNPGPKMLTPSKDADKCPKQVPGEGWYVNEKDRGLQYAVVFLKVPLGAKLPKATEDAAKVADGKDVLEIRQPHAQYEPRVTVLHPAQKLRMVNDGPLDDDAYIHGVTWSFGPTQLLSGTRSALLEPDHSDNKPYKLGATFHHWMTGYLWRPTHPWMAVTATRSGMCPPLKAAGSQSWPSGTRCCLEIRRWRLGRLISCQARV